MERSAPELEFFFDFVCPYAYLASTQIETIAKRNGAILVLRPVLLGGLYQRWGEPATESAPKARHVLNDVRRWAGFYGVPLTLPDEHPRRTVNALRLMLLVDVETDRLALMHALYRAYWVDGQDVEDQTVLVGICDSCGLDGAALFEKTSEQLVKDQLRDVTDRAASRDVFGVPTCIVYGELFWGQDRLGLVESALSGYQFAGLEYLGLDMVPDLQGGLSNGR